MPRENIIVARLRERVTRKRQELAEASLKVEALKIGLCEDEQLLAQAAPKKPRVLKKSVGTAELVGKEGTIP